MSISESNSVSLKCQLIAPLRDEQKASGEKIPITAHRGRITVDDLSEQIVNQGSLVRRPDVRAVLDNVGKAAQVSLCKGDAVSIDGLGIIDLKIGGVVNPDGTWKKGPFIYPVMRFEKTFCEQIQSLTRIEIIPTRVLVPEIYAVTDGASQKENSVITPGGLGGITGTGLKIHPTISDEGVYLVKSDEPGAIPIKIGAFLWMKSTELSFAWPLELESGASYGLEVRARIAGGKNLRTSNWQNTLTVL